MKANKKLDRPDGLHCCDKCRDWVGHDGEEPEFSCDDTSCECHAQQPPTHNEVEDTIKKKAILCFNCRGDGFTAEHDVFHNPEDGSCLTCPIQVPCEWCQGEGKVLDIKSVTSLLLAQKKQIEERMPKEYKPYPKDGIQCYLTEYEEGWNDCLAAVKEALSE